MERERSDLHSTQIEAALQAAAVAIKGKRSREERDQTKRDLDRLLKNMKALNSK